MKPGPTTDPKDVSRLARGDEIVTPVRAEERLYVALDCADAATSSRHESRPFARYVPLLSWAVVLITLLFIPLKIISYGFLAPGDARRHVAKAFTDKPYAEIVVMRPEYKMDHSPGWEWLLRKIQRTTGWGSDELMSFCVISMMLCVLLAPLPWLRRPEAWLAALLAEMIAIPELMSRFAQARPYLLTQAILIMILFTWSRNDEEKVSRLKVALTSLGIAISVWVHGAWYLWALPISAFFLAGGWRKGLSLACCIGIGTIAGAMLTGTPIQFLCQALAIARAVSQEHVPQWLLVGELRPSYGEFTTAALVAVLLLWRRQELWFAEKFSKSSHGIDLKISREVEASASVRSLCGNPVFCLMVISWILGFKADRFWADWGLPAVLVWVTRQLEEGTGRTWGPFAWKRVMTACLLVVPLFLQATNDLDRRYSGSLAETFLDGKEPSLRGWLPEPKGIFYSSHMEFFYNTFYRNPDADWRYILGMEPALMPDDDLQIFRRIQRNQFALKAYEPWVEKMKPEDRLAVPCSFQPALPQLEWVNAGGDLLAVYPPCPNAQPSKFSQSLGGHGGYTAVELNR
jgi:hypothetical protein